MYLGCSPTSARLTHLPAPATAARWENPTTARRSFSAMTSPTLPPYHCAKILPAALRAVPCDPDVAVDQKTSFAAMFRRSSPPVLSPCVSTRVFTLSIETRDRTTTIIDGTPQIHCSDLELLPCARTSVTRLCHGLAPLHGPLSKRATATLAPTYTFPLDLNILRYIAPNLKFYAKRRSLIFVLVPSLAL